MMAGSISDWATLAREDPGCWRASAERAVHSCIEKTDTSVVSADLSRTVALGEGPLAGVPYGLKDLFDYRGLPTHSSSVVPEVLEAAATKDSELVKRLRGLGASCVAKTQMNEFAYGLSGENPHYGNCPHPRLDGCLSGGSSSGSAHIVAAGYLPLAFGTDTGGSIRLPAAWCGLYGIRWKPGYCMEGGFPLSTRFDTMGWFTRSAGEMETVLQAWFGQRGSVAEGRLRGAFFNPEAYQGKEAYAALEATGEALALKTHADFSELEHWLPQCNGAFNVIQSREAFAIHEAWLEPYGRLYDPAVKARIERARDWTAEDIEEAEATAEAVTGWFDRWFAKHDFLAMPICPGPSIPPSESTPDLREKTLRLTTPASLAQLPALAVPVWLDAERSVGIQFIFREVAPEVPLALLKLCANT